ncbi:hypothetical protein Scep_007332 [Stephania cephalantha]|uniref:Uncharacterized protein n=1 Tax=Stephania cephalantha TaxID=152367 RepID=A0AAP0KCC8_9MAGN
MCTLIQQGIVLPLQKWSFFVFRANRSLPWKDYARKACLVSAYALPKCSQGTMNHSSSFPLFFFYLNNKDNDININSITFSTTPSITNNYHSQITAFYRFDKSPSKSNSLYHINHQPISYTNKKSIIPIQFKFELTSNQCFDPLLLHHLVHWPREDSRGAEGRDIRDQRETVNGDAKWNSQTKLRDREESTTEKEKS